MSKRIDLGLLAALGFCAAIVGMAVSAPVGVHPSRMGYVAPAYTEAGQIETPNGPAQVRSAYVSVATAAAHSVIVTGVAGETIEVIGWTLCNNVAGGTSTWETSTSNTVIGKYSYLQYVPNVQPNSPYGYERCGVGDNLDLTCGGSSATVTGHVMYVMY